MKFKRLVPAAVAAISFSLIVANPISASTNGKAATSHLQSVPHANVVASTAQVKLVNAKEFPVLRKGTKSAAVRDLRFYLGLAGPEASQKDYGYSPTYDATLKDAVAAFQGAHGLAATGNTNIATWTAILTNYAQYDEDISGLNGRLNAKIVTKTKKVKKAKKLIAWHIDATCLQSGDLMMLHQPAKNQNGTVANAYPCKKGKKIQFRANEFYPVYPDPMHAPTPKSVSYVAELGGKLNSVIYFFYVPKDAP